MALANNPEILPTEPTVLVVDDDHMMRNLYRSLLTREGYRVIEAVDGEQALQMAAEHLPDTVIMDVLMPVLDGLEATRRLKADPDLGDIPVIMTSAKTDASDTVAGLEAGADEYLTKPIRHKEFALRVRSMVRYRGAWLDLQQSIHMRAQQARALGLLLDFSRRLATAKDLQDVLDSTLLAAASLMGCRRVSIMLADDDREFLTVAAAIGCDDQLTRQVRVPVGHEIAGKVFDSGTSLVVNSPDAMPANPERYESVLFASVPLVSTALTTSETTVGVLNVTGRKDRRPFDAQDLEYLDLVSNSAATAIHDTLTRKARDEARDSVVFALARLAEHRDSETGKHLERMVGYCLILARQLRKHPACAEVIDDEFLEELERTAPLHDIGKVAVPDRILLKPGKLTPEERTVMQSHADIGAETIHSVRDRAPGSRFLKMAEDIAHYHHEWFDGSGYPHGLSGDRIPLAARIAALADVYDALTSERIYKQAWIHDRAVAEIARLSGRQFDPEIVEAMLEAEDDFKRLSAELADPPADKEAATGQDVPHDEGLITSGQSA